MKQAIVTGANGFVGAAVVNKLISENIEVLAIDLSFSKSRLPKSPLIKTIEMSIADIHQLVSMVEKEYYDTFYHFAWVGLTGKNRKDDKVQIENAVWNINCLRLAKEIGCKRFICAGSIMEYEIQAAVYAQETKPGMSYIYGAGKVLAHQMCKLIANEIGIDLIWTYITNTYGVGEISDRFINTTLRKIINNERLEFTAGIQNYDFIYIDDVANAFYLLGLKGKANKGYMIGSGNAKPLKEFIIEMIKTNAPNNQPHFGDVPFTGVNIPLETYDITPLVEDCGFKPTISFAEGTKLTMEWLKKIC